MGTDDMTRKTTLLYLVRDPFPTPRPDVEALFGRYLPRHGIASRLIAQRKDHGPRLEVAWSGGDASVCGRSPSRWLNHVRSLVHDIGALWRLDEAFAAVVVRDKILVGLFGLIAARRSGVPFCYWMSYPIPDADLVRARVQGWSLGPVRLAITWMRGRATRWLLYRVVLPHADHVFVQSHRMREVVASRYGVPVARMTPVPMGVDLATLADNDAPGVADPRLRGRRLLVYLGSLEKTRRVEFLFHVLRLVAEKVPNAVLIVAGDAEEPADREYLRAQAVAAGVAERIIWTGWLPMQEAWNYVRRSDVGLSIIPPGPLYDVSSPTKTIEYMALGVPVVANDIPDQARVLNESGGGICVGYDHVAAADAVCRILEDSTLASRMRERGPQYVKQHRSYAALAEQVAAKFYDIAAKKGER